MEEGRKMKKIKNIPWNRWLFLIIVMILLASVSSVSVEAQPWKPVSCLKVQRKGWQKKGRDRFFYRKGKPVTGKQTIKGKLYYFGKNGKLYQYQGRHAMKERGGLAYYYWNKDHSIRKNQWIKYPSAWYYAGKEGKLYTGKHKIQGVEYLFDKNGKTRSFWRQDKTGSWHYYSERGKEIIYTKDQSRTNNYVCAKRITKKTLDKMNLKNVENLMIVAHPDDDILWGGEQLMKQKYLVVCMTNGTVIANGSCRGMEFRRAMEQTGDSALILQYPDYRPNTHEKSNWSECTREMRADLQCLLSYKKWKKIVTHNPQGEYGHIHHKMTSNNVTEISKRQGKFSKLYYFGKYYKESAIPGLKHHLKKVDEKIVKKMKRVGEAYSSQYKTVQRLQYMMKYQNCIPASRWKS